MADSSTQAPTSPTSATPSTLSSSWVPGQTDDNGPGSPNNESDDDSNIGFANGMTSYYFVFLMLALLIIGIVIFLNFRRRRKRRLLYLQGRGPPPDSYNRGERQRRYLPGRWGSANVSREEGLNEHGEAPPPYLPKRQSQEGAREGGQQAADGGPAVPLQTLSREEAGLKPPDYEEARGSNNDDGDDVMRPARRADAGASSSQHP